MEVDGHIVLTDPAEIFEVMRHEDVIGYDTETTGLSPWTSTTALMQFYGEKSGIAGLVQTPQGVIPPAIKQLFTMGKTFVVHNGVGFDILFADTHGIEWEKSKWFDTLVGETVVVGSGRRNVSVSLRNTIKRRTGGQLDKSQQKSSWNTNILSQQQIEYAVRDVLELPNLRQIQIDKAGQTGQMEALEMEMELVPIFTRMCLNGLPINESLLDQFLVDERRRMEASRVKLLEAFGDINLNSPAQLKKAFWNKNIQVPGTAKDVMQDLVLFGGEAGELAGLVLAYRDPAQSLKMYRDEWQMQHIVNGKVHPHFWQCSTDTGRISSSNPNIQQIPKDARKVFGGVEGKKIISCDYSQIEVRIAAYISRDEVLINALGGEDVHREIASIVYGIPPAEVQDKQRKMSKALTFTLLFGGGVQKLYDYARRQGGSITFDEAQELHSTFFERFSGLAMLLHKADNLAQSPRPVVTIRLPNGLRRNLVGQDKKSTVIVNTSVQGSAAVGLKHGLLELQKRGLVGSYLGATVHDECVACVPDAYAQEYALEMEKAMVAGMEKIIPVVKAETKIGDVWQ